MRNKPTKTTRYRLADGLSIMVHKFGDHDYEAYPYYEKGLDPLNMIENIEGDSEMEVVFEAVKALSGFRADNPIKDLTGQRVVALMDLNQKARGIQREVCRQWETGTIIEHPHANSQLALVRWDAPHSVFEFPVLPGRDVRVIPAYSSRNPQYDLESFWEDENQQWYSILFFSERPTEPFNVVVEKEFGHGNWETVLAHRLKRICPISDSHFIRTCYEQAWIALWKHYGI